MDLSAAIALQKQRMMGQGQPMGPQPMGPPQGGTPIFRRPPMGPPMQGGVMRPTPGPMGMDRPMAAAPGIRPQPAPALNPNVAAVAQRIGPSLGGGMPMRRPMQNDY